MATTTEDCAISETIIPVFKQKLATKKYRSAQHWFWSGFKRYPFQFIISMVFLIVDAFLGLVPSILLGLGIDVYKSEGFTINIIWITVSIILAAIVTWGVTFAASYIWVDAAFKIERDIRQEYFEVIQDHSMAFHDENDSGVLLSMGMNEISQIRFAYNPASRLLLNTALSIILTCVYFFINIDIATQHIGVGVWQIGLGVSIAFVIYFLFAWRYATKIGPVRRALSKELGELSSATQEVFRGIEVVRSFDSEEKEEKKFRILSDRYASFVLREGFLGAFYWPSLIIIGSMGVAFVVGIYLIPVGMMTTGDLAAMLALLTRLLMLNFMLPIRLLMLQAGLINAQRIWDVMSFKDPLMEPATPLRANWDKELIFDNVSFSYPGTDRKILKNISFKIPPGSRVAVLGGPGSGKSTVLKLLLRLYDPTEGAIILDGCKFSDMATVDIRKDVTLVEQDIFLFSASIRDNITFSKPGATDEEVRIAARRAQALRFIEASPEGFDTQISERGVTLSGGQRQRVAIARALLANPKLLLLDDSTSAVDVKTEARLRLAMEELIQGRTSIIVTQRLSALAGSDMIVFLDKGEIVDIGTHEELRKRCQQYQFMLKHLPSDTAKDGGAD